jgi:hypothetical protein
MGAVATAMPAMISGVLMLNLPWNKAVKNNENVLKIALRLGVRGGSEATDLFKNSLRFLLTD